MSQNITLLILGLFGNFGFQFLRRGLVEFTGFGISFFARNGVDNWTILRDVFGWEGLGWESACDALFAIKHLFALTKFSFCPFVSDLLMLDDGRMVGVGGGDDVETMIC